MQIYVYKIYYQIFFSFKVQLRIFEIPKSRRLDRCSRVGIYSDLLFRAAKHAQTHVTYAQTIVTYARIIVKNARIIVKYAQTIVESW